MAFPQIPLRGYPGRAHPARSLVAGVSGSLALAYRDLAQLPKRSYPLGGHPELAIVAARPATNLGLTYRDFCQRPKRGYPLAAHPGRGLVCAAIIVAPPQVGGGGAGGRTYTYSTAKEPRRRSRDDKDILEIVTIIARWL